MMFSKLPYDDRLNFILYANANSYKEYELGCVTNGIYRHKLFNKFFYYYHLCDNGRRNKISRIYMLSVTVVYLLSIVLTFIYIDDSSAFQVLIAIVMNFMYAFGVSWFWSRFTDIMRIMQIRVTEAKALKTNF